MIYFTSDLHIGHYNILRFDKRPFKTVEENDMELIKRWNNKVKPEDTVYVLGDMIWKHRSAEAIEILNRLNGNIILIQGNHDQWVKNTGVKKKLTAIKDYDDICVTLKDGTPKRCILSHYPIPFYNGHYYGAIMLYGHVHITEEYQHVQKIEKWLNENNCPVQMYNVGCMLWDYEPVTLDEILAKHN